jgi:nucleoside-diphosphate-sugar epimerase
MSRILLTGATGFIGARVAERLAERGHALALLLRKPRHTDRAAALYGASTLIAGDLADPQSYAAAMRSFAPDTVIHAAWHGVAGADRNDFSQLANIQAAAWLAAEAIASGATAFVGLGSQAEYGPHSRMLDETAQTQPTTLYGHSKLAACEATRAVCRTGNIRHAWMRVFSTYGPRDNPGWMIPSLIAALKAGEKPALTAGEQKWGFLFVDDAADAIAMVAENGAADGIFNLGSADAPLLRDTVSLLRDLVAPGAALGFGEVPYRPDQVMHLQADIARLRRVTGWSPRIDLASGLDKTVRWFTSRQGLTA